MLPSLFLFAGALLSTTAYASLAHKGADISSLLMLEGKGKSYKWTDGYQEGFEYILAKSGGNTARQRLWVNPADGVYNLDYNVKLSKRAVAAGLSVYLDLHYSDSWADPSKQVTPSIWDSSKIGNLKEQVYTYTKNVCNRYATEGISPSIVSIGNEIRNGLLWPLGDTPNYYNIADLLHSASAGVKDSTLKTKPKIMVHLDNGWDWDAQKYFYNTVLSQGPFKSTDFDMIGVSYYPFYNSKAYLGSLEYSLDMLSSTYGKQIAVAETNWPTSCPNAHVAFPSDTTYIPFSEAGQAEWIQEVAKIVAGTKNGVGLFYWEPGFLGNAPLGSSCTDNLMVKSDGTIKSSFSVFGKI